jgi:MFS transporter, ACS family, D-galactonate transporter
MALPRSGVAPEAMRQDAAPALKESPARWWLLALLFTGMLFSYVHRGALSVSLPSIKQDFNLNEFQLGLLSSSFFLIYAFMQVPGGWLVDRFGVRRVYGWSFAFWSLMSALTGLAVNFATLFGLRVAVGVGQSALFPASSRATANWFQERERGFMTAIYLTGVRFGTALVSFVGGYFLVSYSWKLFFVVTGLVPLVWLLPWHAFLRKWEPTPGASAQTVNRAPFWKSFTLLRHRSVLGIFLGFFAYDYAWYVFITWLPGYLRLERGFTPTEMGVYSAVPFLVMSVIILCSGLLSDWLVRRGGDEMKVRKTLICVGMMVALLIVPAGMVEDKMTAVWLLTVSLCGLGVCAPNTWTLTQAVCEKKIVGTVTGIQNFGGNIPGILAPALTGYIAHATGSFALALGVVGAVLVGGMVSYWFLVNEKVAAEEAGAV